jgi:uncharacterized protein (TIGR02271 family)
MGQTPMTVEELQQLRGAPVYANNHEKIGLVEEIFADYQIAQPEWLGVGTGFLRTKRVLVPVAGAWVKADAVYVPYEKDLVKDSPDTDDDELSQDTERALYSHYGMDYSERDSASGLPEGTSTAKTGQESVTRSEEEMKVGKRDVERGRVRVHKWVETEPVTEDVELRRETAKVEREPINQAAPGAKLGEEDIEVPLRAEEPVIEKQTVAKEKVTVSKDSDTETKRVADDLKKERVDVTGEGIEEPV